MIQTTEIEYWPFKKFLETEFPESDPIISGLVNKSELILLTATAKTGKTWLALHLGLSVVSGGLFLGKFLSKPSRVLILQTEVSNDSFRERIKTAIDGELSDPDAERLFLANQRIKLDKGELAFLKKLIESEKIELVILDPLYTLHSRDENSATEIASLLSDLKALLVETNAACVLVQHQGKRGEFSGGQTSHKARGSSAFGDVPDGIWNLDRTKDKEVLSLSFEMRNHTPPDPLSVRRLAHGTWETLDSGSEKNRNLATAQTVALILKEEGRLSKDILVMKLKDLYGKSLRTFEALIKEALVKDLIDSSFEGRKVFYSIKEPPQFRSSLGDCGVAELNSAANALSCLKTGAK
jgi:hypothetical protein